MGEINYIAIGVVTYGHPEVVEHVLENCFRIYKACQLDVYYYDSSPDRKTEEVVKNYIDKGYDNFHYLRLPAGMGSAKKAELFFSGYGLEKDYAYLWLMKDRVMVESPLLLSLYEIVMLDKPDVVLLNGYGDHDTPSELLTDAADFYKRWGREVTSMDTTLLKRESMLKGFEASERDFGKDEPVFYFFHYDTVFRRLADMNAPQIRVLSGQHIKLFSSPKGSPGWINELFDIWTDRWIRENEALPSCYDRYKDEVIRGRALPVELKSREGLLWLKTVGALRREQLSMILKNWSRISELPEKILYEVMGDEEDAV